MGSSVQERTNANIIDLIVTVCIVYLFYSLHNLQYSICKSYTFFANYLSITITDVMITFYKQIKNLIGAWTIEHDFHVQTCTKRIQRQLGGF